MPFTRSRSAFLLTSVLAASALFIPEAGNLWGRLADHTRFLASNIVLRQHKSIEIVLGFMVNVPWMSPSNNADADATCFYLATATTIAIDLALHKVVLHGDVSDPKSRSLPRGECLDARTALVIDGYTDLDPGSPTAKLLLRQRERCWICLFALERGWVNQSWARDQ